MAEQLDEIRARRDAAKGPWHFEERDDDIVVHLPLPDAEFIAHAPADVGWLLEHIEQLQRDHVEVWRCPECGFTVAAEHIDAGWRCPACVERELSASVQAVLDRCAQAPRKAPTADYMRLIADILAALGAADER